MNTQHGLTVRAGTHPLSAKFLVGEQELTVIGCDIRMRYDEVVTAVIEVPVEHIDVELMRSGVTIAPITHKNPRYRTALLS